jgi:hypothetical protein
MEKEKVFRECSLEWLEDNLGVKQVKNQKSHTDWLVSQVDISEHERASLLQLQESLDFHFRDWNEQELDTFFIGPMFALVQFNSELFNIFAQRKLEGQYEDWHLYGEPDSMIATGRRSPKIPFFAFQEYKKFRDPKGDPAGQALAAMLVGQSLNNNDLPMYGCHVIGADWYFKTLEGKSFCISRDYSALTNEIFDIYRILKSLKRIIEIRTQ